MTDIVDNGEVNKTPEVPEKIQKVLNRLKKDSDQPDPDPQIELIKNVKTNLTVLSIAELWVGRNKEDADQLMSLGLEKIKGFYPDSLPLVNQAVTESITELRNKHGDDNLLAKLLESNKGVLHEEDK